MTDSARDAWSEVGRRFTSWGHQVTDRYRAAEHTEDTETPEGDLRRGAKEIVGELSRGFSALEGTLRDTAANKDLSDAVSAIGDAIGATVEEAGRAIRSGGSGS